MSLRAAALFVAGWQLSCSTRPELLSRTHELQGEAEAEHPEGWSEVLVPVSHEQLGLAGKSHSQVGQDKLVQHILNCKKGGFYLDLAANEAVIFSNTLMLERDYGWTGICMEANPQYMLNLAKRKCQVVLAAVGSPSNQDVKFAFRDIFGGIVSEDFDNAPDEVAADTPTVHMKTKSIAEILTELNAPKTIDYMSLDVEGAEDFVMKGFPWETHRISVMTVERPPEALKQKMISHGMKLLRENSLFDDETWVDAKLYDEAANASWMALWKDVQKPPSDATFHESCPIDQSV